MGYAQERVSLWPRLRHAAQERATAELFRLDARLLRFHLGTSLADLRVPVAIDDALKSLFAHAALDLFYLLCMRHRSGLRDGEYDQLLLRDGFDPQLLRPLSYGAPAAVTREPVRRMFIDAPDVHPALDGGLIAGWIAQGRPGRMLLGALNTMLSRAREESSSGEPREPTPYLALLAIRSLADSTMAAIRQQPISPSLSRPLVGAVSAGLLLAIRLAAREAGLSQEDAVLEACVLPLPWLASGKHLWGSGLTLYGVAFSEAPAQLEAKTLKLIKGGLPEQIVREALAELVGREVSLKVERMGALSMLRGDLFASLRQVDLGRSPSVQLDGISQAQLFGLPGALEKVMGTPERRKELAARAAQNAKACTHEAAKMRMEAIALAAREWTEDHPSHGWLPPGAAHNLVSQSIAALSVDFACERLLDHASRSLSHRRGGESEEGLTDEYERGRLYWFSFTGRPILAARAGPIRMGHLFCDVKDFTKRTAMLKEAVVADFLQREFYQPILTAAARHHHGAAHLHDKGGLYLNNLLGDAVSFSGDITSLVELASDIRVALQSYARRLDGDANHDVVARSAQDIEDRVAARRAILDEQVSAADDALAKGTIDPVSGDEPRTRLRVLYQERARLEEEREQELALVRGEKLEAGIFISYGAAPEVATFEDHVFGAIKVAIAEKINESARGTARNLGVRARVDALLAAARVQKKQQLLPCPLQVFIAQPLSIPVAPELEVRVRGALELGDLEGAEKFLRESVHSFVQRLSHESLVAGGGDVYNGGAALSEEALEAYIQSRAGDDLMVLRRELPTASLHPRLAERFVFPQQQLSLLMLVGRSAQALVELFVYSGRAIFRGLEKTGGLAVYEMIPRGSPFFSLLAEHHVGAWIAREH